MPSLELAVLALALATITLSLTTLGRPFLALFLAHAGLTWALASRNFFSESSLPPRIPLYALATILLGVIAWKRLRPDAPPVHRVIAFQSFRLPLELLLFAFWRTGDLPQQMTFEGQNFDVLVGLTAPLIAWLLATKRITPRIALAWNFLGVALLLNVLRIAVTSFPGPLHADWPGEPLTVVARWPFVLIPALFVPFAAWGHLFTARELWAGAAPSRSSETRAAAAS
ncbi:MAG: hypothetical protein U0228_25925 [Myxococcaceae bacterium]